MFGVSDTNHLFDYHSIPRNMQGCPRFNIQFQDCTVAFLVIDRTTPLCLSIRIAYRIDLYNPVIFYIISEDADRKSVV